jgi:molybdenum cofactor guanylyltransferase
MAPMQQTDITGLILCGGAATRMGGQDKGLVCFHGRPLVDIAIDRLTPQVGPILISANRNTEAYAARGFPVLKDPTFQDDGPNYEGPLAGILAGLNAASTPWIMTVPCDCPRFPNNLVARLIQASPDPVLSRYMAGHPTFSLVPVSSVKSLMATLQRGHRKLSDWLTEQRAVSVPVTDQEAFRNLNSPQDF